MIARRYEDKITPIKDKQDAQIPPDATFVKSAKWTNSNAGVHVGTAKNFRQPGNDGTNRVLPGWRQPFEGA